MRIIGGNLKGKKLFSVPAQRVRPTADRLRESIFNILSLQVQGAIVLDLFSGTGALGIEALSRGAQRAVFIEKSKEALTVIRRNIQACALENQAQIIKWNIEKNLDCIKAIRPAFDLVLMDPPYNKKIINNALLNLHLSLSLQSKASVVVEHSLLEVISEDITEFIISDQRKYGKTLVTFLTYVI